MPTGYTDAIKKGITFREFALSCARAFGACITMRDDPSGKPIPDKFQPSDWNKKQLAESKRHLTELNGTGVEEATRLATAEYELEMKEHAQEIEENRKLMAQYRAMLEEVKAWHPPTSDHTEFKVFMITQIKRSIDFDGMEEYHTEHQPVLLSGEEWLARKKQEAQRDIVSHTKENKAEIERTNHRNKWIADLRDSLR